MIVKLNSGIHHFSSYFEVDWVCFFSSWAMGA